MIKGGKGIGRLFAMAINSNCYALLVIIDKIYTQSRFFAMRALLYLNLKVVAIHRLMNGIC